MVYMCDIPGTVADRQCGWMGVGRVGRTADDGADNDARDSAVVDPVAQYHSISLLCCLGGLALLGVGWSSSSV